MESITSDYVSSGVPDHEELLERQVSFTVDDVAVNFGGSCCEVQGQNLTDCLSQDNFPRVWDFQ